MLFMYLYLIFKVMHLDQKLLNMVGHCQTVLTFIFQTYMLFIGILIQPLHLPFTSKGAGAGAGGVLGFGGVPAGGPGGVGTTGQAGEFLYVWRWFCLNIISLL